MLKETTIGILLQGNVRGWTIPIIEEHQQNFPDSEIVLSTWDNEDISDVPCKVVQTKVPEPTQPYKSSKNYQIIGSRCGLKSMKSDIILKTRTDIFIHNPNIFKIFFSENTEKKIMYAHLGLVKEFRDYWINDFCQLSSKETLLNFWNLMPLHDGSDNEAVEKYLTRNYLKNESNNDISWNKIHDKYFIRKRFYEDFQIEFEKFTYLESYQDNLLSAASEDPDDKLIFYSN